MEFKSNTYFVVRVISNDDPMTKGMFLSNANKPFFQSKDFVKGYVAAVPGSINRTKLLNARSFFFSKFPKIWTTNKTSLRSLINHLRASKQYNVQLEIRQLSGTVCIRTTNCCSNDELDQFIAEVEAHVAAKDAKLLKFGKEIARLEAFRKSHNLKAGQRVVLSKNLKGSMNPTLVIAKISTFCNGKIWFGSCETITGEPIRQHFYLTADNFFKQAMVIP